MRRSWKARSSRQRGDRVGAVEEQRARDEAPRSRRAPCRPAAASAAVGHSVEHQRFSSSPRAAARRARATRAIRVGVDAGQLARVVRRLDAEHASIRLASSSVRSGTSSRWRRARARRSPRLAGQLDAQQRPGVALEDRALQLEQQRRGERRRAHEDLLPRLDVEAVAGQQVARRRRVQLAHGASRSGKCSARCSRRTSRIQRRSSWVATRRRTSSSRWPSGHVGDHPAHGEALEQELDRALPGVLLGEHVAVQHVVVLAAGLGRQRAAQHERVALRRGVLALGGAELLDLAARAAALAHAYVVGAACSSCPRTSPVSGRRARPTPPRAASPRA